VEALLNWLWQGGIVAIATAAILRVIEPFPAQARYRTLWIALVSVLILPGVPLAWAAVSPAREAGNIPATVGSVVSIPIGGWTFGTLVIALWAMWSSVYACRIASAALAIRRAKTHCEQISPQLEARLRHWTEVRTTGRQTRVVLSRRVRSAAVLGCAPPVIAVAPALLDHLSDDELDRVVIHEWAHVQRRDDVANLVQLLVRATAGWHPAVWWFDRQLHIEREIACDEMAVAVTGSAKRYAACLAKLASLPALPLRSFATVAAVSSAGLRERIVRILSHGHVASVRSQRAASVGVGVLLCALALTVGGFRFVEAAAPLTNIATTVRIASADNPAMSDSVVPYTAVESGSSNELADVRPQPRVRIARQMALRNGHARAGTAAILPTSTSGALTDSEPLSHPGEQPSPDVISRPTVTFASLDSSPVEGAHASSSAARPSAEVKPVSVWSATADAGVAVGRGSQKAALATASFFSRIGKKIAGSF